MTTIARGNTGRLSVVFAPLGDPVALADVTCTVTSPSAIPDSLTVYTSGTNRFYADVVVSDLTQLGQWTVRWDSDPPSELITITDTYQVVEAIPAAQSRSLVGVTVNRIRRQLDAAIRHETNRLGANLDDSEEIVTLEFDIVPSCRSGTVISVGRELMRVMSVNYASHELTVIRHWQDSVAESHADASEVLISPRFTRFDIYDAIIQEIESWAPQLFRVVSYQATVTDEDESFELPAALSDAIGLVDLRRNWEGESESTAWPTLGFRLMRGEIGTWSAASTSGLRVRMLPHNNTMHNGTVHALVAYPFDLHSSPLLEEEDLVDDYGLAPSMLEVVELGVKMRIIGDQETGRTARSQQDEPRRAEENPAGAALQLAQTIRSNYTRRFGDEVRKLQHRYKVRAW